MKLTIPKKILHVAIIDDDVDLVADLSDYVSLTNGLELLYTSTDAVKALAVLPDLEIDLLFLDMEMPVLDGLKLMAQLRSQLYDSRQGVGMQVVVCSAYEQFAAKTYDFKVTDYLTKPFTFERYMQAVDEVKSRVLRPGLNRLSNDNECLMVFSDRGILIRRVRFSDIAYLEAREEKTRVWISDAVYYEVEEVLKKVLLRLPRAQFVRVHRSYAIAVDRFVGMEKKSILLRGLSAAIPIGDKDIYKTFTDWLVQNAITGRRHILPEKDKKKEVDEESDHGEG